MKSGYHQLHCFPPWVKIVAQLVLNLQVLTEFHLCAADAAVVGGANVADFVVWSDVQIVEVFGDNVFHSHCCGYCLCDYFQLMQPLPVPFAPDSCQMLPPVVSYQHHQHCDDWNDDFASECSYSCEWGFLLNMNMNVWNPIF